MNAYEYLNKIAQVQKKSYEITGFGKDKASDVLDIPFYKTVDNKIFTFNKALEAGFINPIHATESDYEKYPLLQTEAVVNDECLTVLPSRPVEFKNFGIDWLSFTVSAEVFEDYTTKGKQGDERLTAIVRNVSMVLEDITGFAVSHANPSGRNFYSQSYDLAHKAGVVCIGGQKNTVLIVLNSTGCTYGKKGWEGHLNAWFELYAPSAKITRIDIAKDVINFVGGIHFFDNQDSLGGFAGGGRKPKIEKHGNWKRPDGKGLTLYIGRRDSPKFCRIYEKGKQLGDKYSNWLRVEVEFKAKGVLIPFDVLVTPSKYFLTAYKCFHIFEFDNCELSKFEVMKKQDLISFEKSIELVKKQFGRYLYAFRQVYKDDELLLDILTDIDNKSFPERLDASTIPKLTHKDEKPYEI